MTQPVDSTDEPVREPDEDQTASPLRARMLQAAQRLVERQHGLTLSLDGVTLEQAAHEAGLSRSSMYRVWSRREDFQIDLLCSLAGPAWQGYSAFDEATIFEARKVLAEHLTLLATPDGRRAVMREAVRLAATSNFVALSQSVRWRTYVALTATADALEEEDSRRLVEALATAEQVFNTRMSEFYGDMALALGYKLREGVSSFTEVAAAGAAVVEGLALRKLTSPSLTEVTVAIDNPPFSAEWSLAAASFLRIVEGFIVPEEDYDPSLALSRYLISFAEREAAAFNNARPIE